MMPFVRRDINFVKLGGIHDMTVTLQHKATYFVSSSLKVLKSPQDVIGHIMSELSTLRSFFAQYQVWKWRLLVDDTTTNYVLQIHSNALQH